MGAPGPARCYDAFEIDGQRYTWAGDYAHTRRDNKISIMASWQTDCRTCGQPFLLHHPQRPAPTYPVRNCPRCVINNRAEKAATALNPASPSQTKQPAQHPAKEAREAYRTQPTDQTSRVTGQEHHHIPITLQDQHTTGSIPTPTQHTLDQPDGSSGARPPITAPRQPPIATPTRPSAPPPSPPASPFGKPRGVFTDK